MSITRREKILTNAITHVCADREAEYGPPARHLDDVGALWATYLRQKYQTDALLSPEDVAHMLVLLKVARTFAGGARDDTYEDMAGYSALAGEVRHPERNETDPAAATSAFLAGEDPTPYGKAKPNFGPGVVTAADLEAATMADAPSPPAPELPAFLRAKKVPGIKTPRRDGRMCIACGGSGMFDNSRECVECAGTGRVPA